MDSPGGGSPEQDGGGGVGGGPLFLTCEHCGFSDTYQDDEADEGFFSCRQCSAVHTTTQTATADPHELTTNTKLFLRHTPKTLSSHTPKPRTPTPYPILHPAAPATAAAGFDDYGEPDEPNEPRDFACGAGVWDDEAALAALAAGIRWRYMRGLQVMLQQQLEALVERFRVGAVVCGVAGSVWLRWVAASKVFDEMWAQQVLTDAEAADKEKRGGGGDDQKPFEVKQEQGWEGADLPGRRERRRIEFIFLRALRKMLPVYSTLAVCFLACHIAREAVLPTDIYRWAMEGKLPYVAAFTEVDRLLGIPTRDCPLEARQLFRPIRVIGAWQLEAAAGSIAQRIGLRLPSVNFYAIAHRCLKELSLPVERILSHACHIYEWALPVELWLSSNPARVPTRVCVMSILIVTLRIMYDINGQGTWEKISEVGGDAVESDPNDSHSVELTTRELLCTLDAAYDKIYVGHDYSKDLHSYLKYCKDVIFSGITFSVEEEHLIEIFWDMYKNREDENPKGSVESESYDMEEMRARDGVNKRRRDGTFVDSNSISPSSKNDALERIKSEMEDRGFHYLPPRKQQRSDGYLQYKRKRLSGSLVYAAHADYYLLLRTFAKLAEVDVRIMHTSVLKLERKLAWIEQQIARSLNTLKNLPSKTKDELRPVSG